MGAQKSLPIAIPATTAHRQFGDLIRRIFSGREHFIVEKDGLPVAAIISMEEYEEMIRERERREQRLKRFEELARQIGEEIETQNLSEEELDARIEAVRQHLYQGRHGDRPE